MTALAMAARPRHYMKAAQINKNKTIRRILMANMLEVKHINKTYKGQVSYQALKQISFSIEEGGFTAVMGPSGSDCQRVQKVEILKHKSELLAAEMSELCPLQPVRVFSVNQDIA